MWTRIQGALDQEPHNRQRERQDVKQVVVESHSSGPGYGRVELHVSLQTHHLYHVGQNRTVQAESIHKVQRTSVNPELTPKTLQASDTFLPLKEVVYQSQIPCDRAAQSPDPLDSADHPQRHSNPETTRLHDKQAQPTVKLL